MRAAFPSKRLFIVHHQQRAAFIVELASPSLFWPWIRSDLTQNREKKREGDRETRLLHASCKTSLVRRRREDTASCPAILFTVYSHLANTCALFYDCIFTILAEEIRSSNARRQNMSPKYTTSKVKSRKRDVRKELTVKMHL